MTKSDSKSGTRKRQDKARPGHSKGSHDQSAKKKRGRPTGKRSDPDFTQTTAYIRAETYKDVRIALLQEGEGREYSELVEELLSGWLKKRK
jgi:hypothetical protein